MKVLLVDDEELQLKRLYNSCEKCLPTSEFLKYTNPVLAFEENKENNKIDLAFLDIEMPGLNGIHASGYISKPVREEKIQEELNELGNVAELAKTKKLQVKCFGNFEVFYNGSPIKFAYQKSKEVFAYLIDREGSVINANELNAVMWEEDHKSYLRNLLADIKSTLKSIDCEDVFVKRHNGYSIDVNKVDCDAYEYKNDNPNAIRMYRGEYMIQYSWAMFDASY